MVVVTWIARGLAVITGLLAVFIMLNVIGELQRSQYPFVLEGAPLGTFEQQTQLNLLIFASGWALMLAGTVLSFRWGTLAARVLALGGLVQLIFVMVHALDASFPRQNLLMGFGLGVLLPFVLASSLVVANRNRIGSPSAAGRSV